MKSTMSLKDYKSKREKTKFKQTDDMSLLIQKRNKKTSTFKNSEFRNNYKNYQYDYEEDFYEPRY